MKKLNIFCTSGASRKAGLVAFATFATMANPTLTTGRPFSVINVVLVSGDSINILFFNCFQRYTFINRHLCGLKFFYRKHFSAEKLPIVIKRKTEIF